MSILSPNTIDHIHTYGRAIEVNEINSQIDFRNLMKLDGLFAQGKISVTLNITYWKTFL